MKRFLLPLLTIISVLAVYGCKTYDYDYYGKISGTVLDYTDNSPIENATILMMPGSRTVQTGPDGNFIYEGLEAGQYTLSVQKSGYQSNRKIVEVISGENSETSIYLTKISE